MDYTRDFCLYETVPGTALSEGNMVTNLAELEIGQPYILDFTVFIKRHISLKDEHKVQLISDERTMYRDADERNRLRVKVILEPCEDIAEKVSRLDDLKILCKLVSRDDDDTPLCTNTTLYFKQKQY
jgi:hypothetical protein